MQCDAVAALFITGKLRDTTHQEQQPIIKLKDTYSAKNKNFKRALQYTVDSLGLRAYIALMNNPVASNGVSNEKF